MNNFKKLEEIELQNVANFDTDKIKSGITANLGSLKFVTNIVELYFPKIVELFLGMLGGDAGSIEQNQNSKKNKYPDLG